MAQTTNPPVAAAAEESFAAIYADMDKNRDIREGAILNAMVVEVTRNQVRLDAGLKSQSTLSVEEFRDDNGELSIKKDDVVKVKLEYLDDGRGNTRLSHLQYRRERAWQEMVDAFENDKTVEGVIRERIKGGYSVHIEGLRLFLPGSLVDLFPLKQENALVGKKEKFYIERLKSDRMSAILNRRLVRERELTGGDLSKLEHKVGDKVVGTVAAVIDYPQYCAFIGIGDGYHGILERDDYAWHRVGNLTEILELGQEIEVKILAIDVDKNQIKLGAKQLVPDTWEQLDQQYPVGTKIFAKVISLKDYGAFVEIEKGIEGLVHVSEMDWLNRNVLPHDILEPGQEIEVMMLQCDKQNRRISLGLKQCRANPWEEFSVTYRKGTKLKGKVVGRQDNVGLFVELPGGLNGLVHLSNLTYAEGSRKEILAGYTNGMEVEVVVLDIDVEKQRIGLGIKQLDQDPHEEFVAKFNNHETITVKVKKIVEKGARVTLNETVEGFLPISEISEQRIESVASELSVGQEIKVQITDINARRQIIVSRKRVDGKRTARAEREHRQNVEEQKLAREKKDGGSFGAMIRKTFEADAAKQDAKAGAAKEDAEGSDANADPAKD